MTPGPWEAVVVGYAHDGNEVPFPIWGIRAGDVSVADYMYEADAKLCAASQDMVQALKLIADACELIDAHNLSRIARAAIAKAIGELHE